MQVEVFSKNTNFIEGEEGGHLGKSITDRGIKEAINKA